MSIPTSKPRRFPILPAVFLSIAGFLLSTGSLRAEAPPPPPPPGMEDVPEMEEMPEAVSPPASPQPMQEGTQDAVPAVPVEVRRIILHDGILSVEVKNISVKEVLTEIGILAGFTVELDPSLGSQPLSVRFEGEEIEAGIARILHLSRVASYRIFYGPSGGIERLVAGAAAPAPTPAPAPPTRSRR